MKAYSFTSARLPGRTCSSAGGSAIVRRLPVELLHGRDSLFQSSRTALWRFAMRRHRRRGHLQSRSCVLDAVAKPPNERRMS